MKHRSPGHLLRSLGFKSWEKLSGENTYRKALMAARQVSRESVLLMLRAITSATCRCPAHSHFNVSCTHLSPGERVVPQRTSVTKSKSAEDKEYAIEMAGCSLRYGEGVTNEVGMDFANLGVKKLCVMTDTNLTKLPAVKKAIESLNRSKISFEVYDKVRVEPTDKSFGDAIDFAKRGAFDSYLAIGGGSVMDTCKVSNLYASKPDAEFLDYVNAPIGKNLPIMHQLKPFIAVPTTSGTGSETTGIAVFDFEDLKFKTGIVGRPMRPSLGLIDPQHTLTMPERVVVNSGFDVLCHALESFTAIPYNERSPRPANPKDRPTYQGSNPISDIWARQALRILGTYFRRAVYNADDIEARSAMHLASSFAGMGFGNAGVHLCHGLSYAISGNVKTYVCKDYENHHPVVPHGLSVVLTAPAVFKYTYPLCPDRHLEAAQLLGTDTSRVRKEDAGLVLSDTVKQFMYDLKVDNGLKAIGLRSDDIGKLVKGTLPQERVTKLSPRPVVEEDLARLFEESMSVF